MKNIKVINVTNSSHIIQLKHYTDDKDIPTLEATFKTGQVYVYHNVPKEVFTVLLESESTGKAFHQLIIGKYAYEAKTTIEKDMKC